MINFKRLSFMYAILMSALIMLSCSSSTSNEEDNPIDPNILTAKEITLAMGTGVNIGNTFDNGNQTTDPTTNIRIIQFYKNAGMEHIRIPTTWMDGFGGDHLADDDGNLDIDHARFKQLVTVIDYAISQDLYVVLNTHHEHWLNDNYDGTDAYNDKFETLWTDIATYFKDYPQNLIFEILNEPQDNFGQGNTQNDPIRLAYTRLINLVGYNAIRETGGKNETRLIQVGVNGLGNHNQLDNVYPNKASLPGGGSDKYLAAHVHSYDPWQFCGQDGSNAAHPGMDEVENSIRNVAAHGRVLDIPLNYGEWGVGRDANASERNTDLVREHYKVMRLTMLDEGAAPTAWDDRGWFGLINVSGNNISFVYNIVPYMMSE